MVWTVFEELPTGAVTYVPHGQLCHVEARWQLRLGFPWSIVPAGSIELKLWVAIRATR